MPDHPLVDRLDKRIVCWISEAGDYKPGDPPPSGYNDRHEWARVQDRAGRKQQRCSRCRLLQYPQEIASIETREHIVYPTRRDAQSETNGIPRIVEEPICLKCEAADAAGGDDD